MSMFARAFARSSAFKRAAIRRGGGGPASYNEPGGYLFNEKVYITTVYQFDSS